MKYFILLSVLLFIGCSTQQAQQPKYYSIEEFIQEYMDSQNVEVEYEVTMD